MSKIERSFPETEPETGIWVLWSLEQVLFRKVLWGKEWSRRGREAMWSQIKTTRTCNMGVSGALTTHRIVPSWGRGASILYHFPISHWLWPPPTSLLSEVAPLFSQGQPSQKWGHLWAFSSQHSEQQGTPVNRIWEGVPQQHLWKYWTRRITVSSTNSTVYSGSAHTHMPCTVCFRKYTRVPSKTGKFSVYTFWEIERKWVPLLKNPISQLILCKLWKWLKNEALEFINQ